MINPNAVRIEGARIGKAAVELCSPGCNVVRAVGQGVCVQERLHCGHRTLPRGKIGNIGQCGLRQTQSKPLIREKEEGTILQNWTAERSSEIILTLFWLRLAREIGKPVVGIQHVVTEIIEERAVKLIRARAGNDRNLSTWRATELRSVGRSLNAKLLEGVHGNQTVRTTKRTKRSERT